MNKKFSTLVASMLLATTVGTVSAQNLDFAKSALPTNVKVENVADGKCYQLTDGWNVLVMQKVSTEKGDRFILKYVPYFEAKVGESLWYVKVIKDNQENGVAFKFMNLAHNYPISFDPAKAQAYKPGKTYEGSYLAGEAVAWAWMRNEAGEGLNVGKTPEAYFKTDSVMTLIPNADGTIASVKYDVRETDKLTELNIRPAVAGSVWLGKNDLNSMLQTQDATKGKVSFSFEKDVTAGLANLWSAGKGHAYEAVDAVGENTLSYGAVADAAAEKDAALLAADEAEKRVEAAVKALAAAESEYTTLAQKLQDVESQKATKSRELVNQSWIYNFLLSSESEKKSAILQLQQSISNNSNINEKAKTELAKLAEKLEAAQQDYNNAVTIQNAFEEAKNRAQESVDVALDNKNKAYDRQQRYTVWGTKMQTYFTKTTDAYYVSDLGADPVSKPEAWAAYYKAASVTTEEDKAAFVEYGHALYSILEENNGGSIEQSAKDFHNANKTAFANGIKALNANVKKEFDESDKAHNVAVGVLESATTDLNDALGAVAEKKIAENAAQKEYDTFADVLKLSDKALAEQKAQLAELQGELSSIQAELQNVSTKKKELETAIAKCDKEISNLNEQLTTLDGDKNATYWAWVDARYAHKDAERVAIKASEVFENIRLEKSFNWLSLKAGKKNGKDTYLMVDTAYLNGTAGVEVAGIQHLGFATREHDVDFKSVNKIAARDINGRFNFRFKYWPTQDSMRIEADGYNVKNVTTKYWADRTNSEIDIFATSAKGQENNLVKIAVLGGARREATIGSSENLKGTGIYTINDRIGLNITPASHPTNVKRGLYFMDVVNSKNAQENDARLMLDLDENLTKIVPADQGKMNFEHMPAAKWYVDVEPTEFGGYPDIRNQETGEILNNYAYKVADKGGKTIVTINYEYQGKTLTNDFVLVPTTSNEEGYFRTVPEARDLFTLNYLNVSGNLNVMVGSDAIAKNDTVLAVGADAATKFVLEPVAIEKYGIAYEKDTLKRGSYVLRVNDPDKLNLTNKYLQVSNVGGTEMLVVSDKATADQFILKEVNCVDGTHYYALICGDKKAGVVDATGLIKAEDITGETRTSAFALTPLKTRFYREFTEEELSNKNMLKFYRTASTEKEYLYTAAPKDGMTFLNVEGKGDNAGAAAEMTVIPTTEAGVLMPQYFIARNVKEQKGSIDFCGEDHANLTDSLKCPHTTIIPDTVFGEFLVNLKIDKKYKKYDWENKYTRLAFLEGYAVKAKDVLPGEGEYTKLYVDGKEVASANAHNAAKFEFRLINENEEQDFLIESESHGAKSAFDGGVLPRENGGWIKIQNGVPVIVAEDFEDAIQGDVFNVDAAEGGSTDNEEIATSEVTVIAGEGQLTIANAAGKKVVVSNILGQVVANTVLSSDNATIAAPQGVVVVAVEGEEAVKAIVK